MDSREIVLGYFKRRYFCPSIFLPSSWLRPKAALGISLLSSIERFGRGDHETHEIHESCKIKGYPQISQIFTEIRSISGSLCITDTKRLLIRVHSVFHPWLIYCSAFAGRLSLRQPVCGARPIALSLSRRAR